MHFPRSQPCTHMSDRQVDFKMYMYSISMSTQNMNREAGAVLQGCFARSTFGSKGYRFQFKGRVLVCRRKGTPGAAQAARPPFQFVEGRLLECGRKGTQRLSGCRAGVAMLQCGLCAACWLHQKGGWVSRWGVTGCGFIDFFVGADLLFFFVWHG